MKTYPSHRLILENAHILRDRQLPPGVSGEVVVHAGEQVGVTDVVAQGTVNSDYVILDVAAALDINPDDTKALSEVIKVRAGQHLKRGDPLGDPAKRSQRRRMPVAPADAVVSLVEHGRVILQVDPETIEVQARLTGSILEVVPNWGVTIESYGTLIQGAWGNGQFNACAISFEPGKPGSETEGELSGLVDLLKMDIALSPYRGKAIVLMRPLQRIDLDVVEAHELGGLIAPTAPPHLRERAMQLKVPVILTEGFGSLPLTAGLYDMLFQRRNTQAILDAAIVDYRTDTRPEIIITSGVMRDRAVNPVTDRPLQAGMRVRISRTPYYGQIGLVSDLPEKPVRMENGLRVQCAQVRLESGEQVMVPQVNLENLGEAQ